MAVGAAVSVTRPMKCVPREPQRIPRANPEVSPSMPRTLFDKIWDAHLVARRADGRDLIYIDRHVLHELHAPHAFEQLEKQRRPVRRPDLTFSMQDHTVATKPGRDDSTNPSGAAFIKAMREGSRRNGIRVFDIDDPEQGISHVVAPELGMVLPGATHAVPDSHASTVGGLGALAFGCGTTELAHILATQVMALRRPKRMLIRLEGRLGPHVTAKDVALRIIAELGVAGARGHVVEYAGAAVRAMPIESRMTLCNLNIEMGGRSGFVAPDDSTFSWIAGRPFAPQGALWERALAHWRTLQIRRRCRVRLRACVGLQQPRAADHLGHRPEPGARHFRPRARSVGRRPEPARSNRKRARLYGARARHGARRPAGRPRVHRLLHQQPPAGPRRPPPRWCAAAMSRRAWSRWSCRARRA